MKKKEKKMEKKLNEIDTIIFQQWKKKKNLGLILSIWRIVFREIINVWGAVKFFSNFFQTFHSYYIQYPFSLILLSFIYIINLFMACNYVKWVKCKIKNKIIAIWICRVRIFTNW